MTNNVKMKHEMKTNNNQASDRYSNRSPNQKMMHNILKFQLHKHDTKKCYNKIKTSKHG